MMSVSLGHCGMNSSDLRGRFCVLAKIVLQLLNDLDAVVGEASIRVPAALSRVQGLLQDPRVRPVNERPRTTDLHEGGVVLHVLVIARLEQVSGLFWGYVTRKMHMIKSVFFAPQASQAERISEKSLPTNGPSR